MPRELLGPLYFDTDPALAPEWVTRLGHDLEDDDCTPDIRRLGRTPIGWRHQIAADTKPT